MSSRDVSMADVLERGIVLQSFEAVAIVQELINQCSAVKEDQRSESEPPSPRHVRLCADGRVEWIGRAGTASVGEFAILLQMLMTGASRVPGGIQYAIARALRDVEGAAFDSVDEFSAVLARHERRDRAAVLRAVGGRVAWIVAGPAISQVTSSQVAASPMERRSTPRVVTELRRQLRTSDQALFESRAARMRAVSGRPAWMRRVPPAVFGLAAGLVVALSAETVRLYRGPTPTSAALETPAIPISPAATAPTWPQYPSALPSSMPMPPAQAVVTETASPVATEGPSEPRASSVSPAKRRVTKRPTPKGSQKPKRRRFFGLPFFS